MNKVVLAVVWGLFVATVAQEIKTVSPGTFIIESRWDFPSFR